MTHPLEIYLTHLQQIHATGGGTAEESYYGPLENLFNEVGGHLQPKVRAVQQLKNRGSGEPDFGFYTADQFQRGGDPIPGLGPERGVAEAKPWTADGNEVAHSEQVGRYLQAYRLVLVTNYREFILIGLDNARRPTTLESYTLAPTAADFLRLLATPRAAAQQHGERLLDFLRRVMLHRAPLTDPEDLAFFLASYAREARARIESATDLRALRVLEEALEEALGMKFEGERGDHFFRATLVQTLFYGIFSSWVLWCLEQGESAEGHFDWRQAAWTLHVPMIRSLFEQIATPTRLKPLGIDEVLNWAGAALNRVNRAAFFSKFEESHAVQYFYEPFLKAYDPELRKELGVWYTPPEIVRYQVERVDRVLREELGLADGLADQHVVVLDPCCGTGAYLVEALRRIYATLEEKGVGALAAQRLKRAATSRIFGFELLPAPFVVAHLQLGLLLRNLGAPLDEEEERAGVFLTNSLTGWEPPDTTKPPLPIPELEAERDAADRVKRERLILVILGNPPYNAFAGVSPQEEGGLVDAYKVGLNTPPAKGGWGIKKFNLDDLYVRFFRIAERRIVLSGQGVVCYISNFSYLGDPSFVVMRQRLLAEFDKLWFDCMNGDSRETGKLTPEGKPDPSVFSTEQNREGIRIGTAIGLFVRKKARAAEPVTRFRHFWGVSKRADLLASLDEPDFDAQYQLAAPAPINRFSFRPMEVESRYMEWPSVMELTAEPPSNGLMEKRGGALMDMDREALAKRMRAYFDSTINWTDYEALGYGLEIPRAGIDPPKLRAKAIKEELYQDSRIVRYALRPFDTVWAYYASTSGIWNRNRPSYWAQCWDGNSFFMTRPAGVANPEGVPIYFTSQLGDNDFQRGHSYYFPVWLRQELPRPSVPGMASLFGEEEPAITANLSPTARAYLKELGLPDPDADEETAALIWLHALAIGYSPAYLSENADGIRQDWPRVPLPASADALRASAALGSRVAALLDTERPVLGVTAGTIRPELRDVAVIRHVGGGQLDPLAGHLDLTAGWGHAGKGGVTMPGRGRVEERMKEEGGRMKDEGSRMKEVDVDQSSSLSPHPSALIPQPSSLNIFLNDHAYWSNVPQAVWEYTIGGYQVIKKWLSYRERPLLGRGLTLEEAMYVTEMARRLAALVLLQPELDANYRAVTAATWAWPHETILHH